MALTEVSGKAAPAAFKSAKMGSKEEATSYSLEWVVTSSSEVQQFVFGLQAMFCLLWRRFEFRGG